MEKIRVEALDGTVDEFYVEAETRLNGSSYLLVSDSEEDDASALILKDISSDTSVEAEYVIVEDDVELEALLNVFQEILEDDADIEL